MRGENKGWERDGDPNGGGQRERRFLKKWMVGGSIGTETPPACLRGLIACLAFAFELRGAERSTGGEVFDLPASVSLMQTVETHQQIWEQEDDFGVLVCDCEDVGSALGRGKKKKIPPKNHACGRNDCSKGACTTKTHTTHWSPYFVKAKHVRVLQQIFIFLFFGLSNKMTSFDKHNCRTTDLSPTPLPRAFLGKYNFAYPPRCNIWGRHGDNLWILPVCMHAQHSLTKSCLAQSLPGTPPVPLSSLSSSPLCSSQPVRMISGLLRLAWLSVVGLKP